MEILTKEVIREIQDYLRAMKWSQNDYRIDQLQLFLKGVSYALWDKGIIFDLVKEPEEEDKYTMDYLVNVYQYNDPADCWSGKKQLYAIYSNGVLRRDR